MGLRRLKINAGGSRRQASGFSLLEMMMVVPLGITTPLVAVMSLAEAPPSRRPRPRRAADASDIGRYALRALYKRGREFTSFAVRHQRAIVNTGLLGFVS